jgi:ribosome-associated toxin RatA of RatAB toxin-antitoxin module
MRTGMPHPSLQRPFRMAALALLLLGAAAPGDIKVELRAVGEGRPKEGIGQGRIEAPPERVFRAISDVEHWHEFMPFLEASDARRLRDGSVESLQRLDLPFPIGRKTYCIRVRTRVEQAASGTVWHADWSYVPGSGNLRDHHGSWTLTAAGPGATLATCRLYTDPGGMAPAGAMDRATGKSLAWIFDGLRQHVRRSRYDAPAPGV